MRNELSFLVVFAATLMIFSCARSDLNSPSKISEVDLIEENLAGSSKLTVISSDFEVSVFAFGLDQPQGLVFDRDGHLYVTEQGSGEISVVQPGDNSSVPPFAFGFSRPIHLVFNGQKLLVSENLSGEVTLVKKGDNSGAPPLISGLSFPTYLNVFESNEESLRLLVSEVGAPETTTEFLIQNGMVINSRIVISYPAAPNINPQDMFIRSGKLFVAQQLIGEIKRFDLNPNGFPINAGSVPAFITGLSRPVGLGFDSKTKNLYVAGDQDVYEIDEQGNVSIIASNLLSGGFNDVIVHQSGAILVSDQGSATGEIWKIVRL